MFLFVSEGRLHLERGGYSPEAMWVAGKLLVEYSQKASFLLGFGQRLVPVPRQ
jgi:hypothetical protein